MYLVLRSAVCVVLLVVCVVCKHIDVNAVVGEARGPDDEPSKREISLPPSSKPGERRCHKNSKNHLRNKGVLRGIYYVVRLDETPPRTGDAGHRDGVSTGGGDGRRRGRRVRRALRQTRSASVTPTIASLDIQTSVANRFSTTRMTSHIRNGGTSDNEAQFVVQIPEKAFISNFTMIINDELFIGKVKEKSLAEKVYNEAKERNESAGKVSSVPRDVIQPAAGMEVFSVSVNIAQDSSIQFALTYQELLERKLGVYTQTISVRPNQIVEDLNINVDIMESQRITFLNVSLNDVQVSGPGFSQIEGDSGRRKEITFAPDKETQKEMDRDKGLNGDLKISYDVFHAPNDAGLVCVDGDYFIHYFSPTGLDPLNKNVVFVIDVSGSMSGHKIEQTQNAMLAILDVLRSGDHFQFILFDDKLTYWPERQGLVPAHQGNIYRAKQFLNDQLKARGSTDINSALLEACRTLNQRGNWGSNIIVFLTDGQPTAGETNPQNIVNNVVREANDRVSVFSLGFGSKNDLDFDLLKRISYRTGVAEGAIRIYPGLDAEQQLKQFFALVNTPLLYNIKMKYPVEVVIVDTLTQKHFPQYFGGSELVVAGKLSPNAVDDKKKMSVEVVGVTTMEVSFTKDVDLGSACPTISRGYVRNLYAYMMIKYLLMQAEKTDDTAAQDQIKEDALNLALEYNLVTPLTSMVITQEVPPEEIPQLEDTVKVIGKSLSPRLFENFAPSSSVHSRGSTLHAPYPQLLVDLSSAVAVILLWDLMRKFH